MVNKPRSNHRISRFSVSWIQGFETCYSKELNQELSNECISRLLIASDPVPLLQAVSSGNFENNSKKLRLYLHLCTTIVDDVCNARSQFLLAGGVPLVTRYMVVNIDNRQVQLASCRMMAAITELGDDAQTRIAECEVVEAVVDALVSYSSDSDIQKVCIVALHNFALHPANRTAMHVTNTLLAIVGAFRVVLHLPTFVALAAATLATSVFQDDRSRHIVGENGAVHVLTEALKIHRRKADVQSSCNLALQNIMFGCLPNISRFRELEGMDALFFGMLAHITNPAVVKSAICALYNVLVCDPTAGLNVITDQRWIILTCNVSKHVGYDPEIADQIIRLWVSLCEYDTSVEKHGMRRLAESIKSTGASQIILKWMQNSILTCNQRLFGGICTLCDVMSVSLGKRDIEPMTVINIERAIELCILAFDAFEKERRAILDALSAMSIFISGRDDRKIKFNNAHGVEAVVKVMEKHVNDERINIECCKILDIAAEGQLISPRRLKGKETLRRVVLETVRRFSDSALILENALSVLVKISASSEVDAADLVRADACSTVREALAKHAENPAVESLASQLIAILDGSMEGLEDKAKEEEDCFVAAQERSRSRTIQNSEEVRARALKSRSPIALHKNVRLTSDFAPRKKSFRSFDLLTRARMMRFNGGTM